MEPQNFPCAHGAGGLFVSGVGRYCAQAEGTLGSGGGAALPEGDSLVFVTLDGQKHTVTGDIFSLGQLRDPRLAGRVWELEGIPAPNAPFEIQKLFTIKDDKRYVVTYYCDVCHIYTHEPGKCMCCQDETVLQEHLEK
jgi:hypothetical protein